MADQSSVIGGFADKIWNGVDAGYEWIRGVIFGEWQDNRSLSQVVADAMVGFVPGLGSIVTLRDLIAVIFRLAKHPEKREDVSEWILLIAMLIPLIITVLGLAAAGIGALVGEEVGGFMRAVALFLVKEGGVGLKVLIDFLHAHGYGAAMQALRKIKFATYESHVIKEMANQIAKLQRLLAQLGEKVAALHPEHWPSWMPGQAALLAAPGKIRGWIEALTTLGQKAHDMIPKALIEMDRRLGALLAGDVKAATQTSHVVVTGMAAPKVERAVQDAEHGVARNTHEPEPGNTRRAPERRVVKLAGKREYSILDKEGRPVGAKPYKEGDKLENPAAELDDWDKVSSKVKEGYPDLATGGREDYANFSSMRPTSVSAGSDATFKRVVGKGRPDMDNGTYYNRELPVDGEDLRAGSAVKEDWNNDGEYIELSVPPKGDPVWQEIHDIRQRHAGPDVNVPYSEDLKFWEGPAASKGYDIDANSANARSDEWALSGGKPQQQFDYEELQALKKRGFVSQRKPTNFPDYDPVLNNIVPKNGPFFEVVPLTEAMPQPKKGVAP